MARLAPYPRYSPARSSALPSSPERPRIFKAKDYSRTNPWALDRNRSELVDDGVSSMRREWPSGYRPEGHSIAMGE